MSFCLASDESLTLVKNVPHKHEVKEEIPQTKTVLYDKI